ncbi:FAD-dependent oxidoreductase [Pseudomonas sp.]|uniref:FAD-dependent oxidoreductase n=1 Tax=Pseudomonas sp. TaxID=306 RepID=UPI00272D9919|nr:FAD-dependent oxidoreductase [Pseudomonas sp.]
MTELHPLILAGAGHAHVVVLRRWVASGFRAPPGSLLLSPEATTWYSGMMPGLLAGRFQPADCAVDLAPLCRAAGIDWIDRGIAAVEPATARIILDDGHALAYRLLSFNVGSGIAAPEQLDDSVELIPAKPFDRLLTAYQRWQEAAAPARLMIIGGGASAFELAVALQRSLPGTDVSMACSSGLLAGHAPGVGRRARRVLAARGVALHENAHIKEAVDGMLIGRDGRRWAANAAVLATGSAAHAWQARSGLTCDERGFLRIGQTLACLDQPDVFATGDCASLPQAPHAGVYALRQGEVLAGNLQAALNGRPLRPYMPQRRALALLATADGGAIASYGPLAFSGRWVGRWKDHLDLSFVRG